MPDQNPIVETPSTPSVTLPEADAILDAIEDSGVDVQSFLNSVEDSGYIPFPKNEVVTAVQLVVTEHISESGNTCWKLVVSKVGFGEATVFIGQEENNLTFNFRLLNSVITLAMHSHGRVTYSKTQPKDSLKKLVDTFIALGGGALELDVESVKVDRYKSGNGEWNQSLKLNPSANVAKAEKTEAKKKTASNATNNARALGFG